MMASAARALKEEEAHEPSSRYRLLRRIGSGGMAEVFLAVNGQCELVVCKRIWPDLAGDPDFIAMFLDEAGLCSRMNHPNVVRTHEVGRDGDQYIIAMEYLRGHSFKHVTARLTQKGGLPLDLHLAVLAEVLAGLQHAHDLTDEQGRPLGIVHRDVSPQNVFVTYDGHVKLVDFGIAKSVAASHRTRPGVLKGRVSYMAPEQVRGGPLDRRADLFSVGVMLWEAAAGRRLWQDLAEAAIVGRLVSGPAIPPPLGPSRLPPGLLRVCRRALALDPAERYASAAEFRAELLPLLDRAPEALSRQLGQLVSGAFAEERTNMEAIARRGIEAEMTASRELPIEVGPPPSATLTESVLRPFVPAPRPRAPERGALGLARLAGLGLLAVTVGFGTIRLLSRPTVPPPPAPVSAAPAPPTFEPGPPPRIEPPAPEVSPPAVAAQPTPTPTPRPARRHRRAPAGPAPAPPVRAAAPTMFEQPMATPTRSRPKPLDVDNPYEP